MGMKYFYSVLIALLLFSCESFAAGIHDADSLYVDSIAAVTPYPSKILGKPDGEYATIDQSLPLVDVSFKQYKGGVAQKSVVIMKGGSTVLVWGKKDVAVDSSAGQLIFFYFDPITQYLQQSQETFYLGEGLNNVPVPAGQWEYIEFSLPGAGLGTEGFAKSYMIDAVALLQDTDAFVGVTPSPARQMAGLQTNYPNPFESMTNATYSLEEGATVQMSVVDISGIEHARIDLGYQEAGAHSEPVMLNDRGMFFLRLFVNGAPYGSPLKIVSQ
jgi:hypothetical protein